jgi:hypothetical protein
MLIQSNFRIAETFKKYFRGKFSFVNWDLDSTSLTKKISLVKQIRYCHKFISVILSIASFNLI